MKRVLYYIYDVLLLLSFILYLPIYIYRRKITFFSFRQKFGFYHKIQVENSIWIQVVSVGEVILIAKLLEKLKNSFDSPIVISTTTLTGYRVAKKNYAHLAEIIFFPLDISVIIKKLIRIIKPKIFIAVETEIWPNLFYRLKRKNVPIIIINGRISDKAFSRYCQIRSIIKPVINQCSYIGVQNLNYQNRFIALGASESKISITGNLKFEGISLNQEHLASIKKAYLPILKNNNFLALIAASTHDPEEEIIIDIYEKMCQTHKNLSLLIAPRHIERIPIIEKFISSKDFNPIRIKSATGNEKKAIYLLDTVGELLYFYALCDICFVGGSLSGSGGHNILEPMHLLKPTCFGPSMENFKDIESIALEKNAALKISDATHLKDVLSKLIDDPQMRDQLRKNCIRVLEDEKVSLEKNFGLIKRCICA